MNHTSDFILYWMIANRRTTWNYSLQRAVAWAEKLNKPLVIMEALRSGYAWASDRLHRFIIDGMADNARLLTDKSVLYYPYLEMEIDEGKGLLAQIGKHACVVVTDDFPAFFLPNMVKAAAMQLSVRLEKVDSNGLLPLHESDRVFKTAYSFRRFLQNNLHLHLDSFPKPDPLAGVQLPRLSGLPDEITKCRPFISNQLLCKKDLKLSALPIDHSVTPVQSRGGATAARKALKSFMDYKLEHYLTNRNHPDLDDTSGLSPYLHFGHISAHQVFYEIVTTQNWSIDRIRFPGTGSRTGWWGLNESIENFLDQLITWRELGYNMCTLDRKYDQYESLPDWVQTTLADHIPDPRPHHYTSDDFESARTHDILWNAAQRQLVREGRLHNYLRMLWGKKILEWSSTPQEALTIMIHLNNKYGLDGRNPNSYSGIFWVLGRYDRAWAERPVFGKVRYMSSKNTARKVRVKEYIKKYGA